jgi:RNA polymerase sigma-70 factor (ECF subfamily)
METDGALIEQSVRGRPDAFVEVVQRHEVAVHGFLARRAGRQVADDLLGEVWVRAFAARGGYDPGYDDALPWLYGIARNVLRAHVLLLVAWEQLTPAEAASVLGVPPGTARSRLHRARAALRAVLGAGTGTGTGTGAPDSAGGKE